MIDEVALVEHLKQNPMFRVGLDVFEVTELGFSSFKHISTQDRATSCPKLTRDLPIYDNSCCIRMSLT